MTQATIPVTHVHTMIGDLPIWTVTVETSDTRHITQTRDYVDVCETIGMAVVAGAKRVTVLDGCDPFLDVTLNIEDVEAGGQEVEA